MHPVRLRRHTLLAPCPERWRTVLAAHPALTGLPADAARLVAAWPDRFPVIARRRNPSDPPGEIAAALPLPPHLGKRRLAFTLPAAALAGARRPSRLAALAPLAPPAWRQPIATLLAHAPQARVFGALLWHSLTGLPYLTDRSDLDLLIATPTLDAALSLARLLRDLDAPIDAEFEAPSGAAAHWREFLTPGRPVLAKSLAGVALLPQTDLFAPPAPLTPAEIATLATQSLHRELQTHPKPGLVTPADPGSHADMDAATFHRAIDALTPHFAHFARAGARRAAFPELRALGLAAEAVMLDATGGINTHRGALFTLGLLAAAAGLATTDPGPTSLADRVRAQWGPAIATNPPAPESHGSEVRARHQVGGARAEAAAGFPHLTRVALPALRAARDLAPADPDAAQVQTLFALLATLPDTNLLHRGGADALHHVQSEAASFLAGGGITQPAWRTRALRLHDDLVARRLSPGGSADLLAAALFLEAYEEAR